MGDVSLDTLGDLGFQEKAIICLSNLKPVSFPQVCSREERVFKDGNCIQASQHIFPDPNSWEPLHAISKVGLHTRTYPPFIPVASEPRRARTRVVKKHPNLCVPLSPLKLANEIWTQVSEGAGTNFLLCLLVVPERESRIEWVFESRGPCPVPGIPSSIIISYHISCHA